MSMQRRGAERADRAVPALLPPGQGCQTPTPHGQVSGPGLLPGYMPGTAAVPGLRLLAGAAVFTDALTQRPSTAGSGVPRGQA